MCWLTHFKLRPYIYNLDFCLFKNHLIFNQINTISGYIEILIDRVLMRKVSGSSPESVRKFVSVQLALSLASGSWRWVECENNLNTEIIRRLQGSECSKRVQSSLSDGTLKNCNPLVSYYFQSGKAWQSLSWLINYTRFYLNQMKISVPTSEENFLVMAFTSTNHVYLYSQ